MILNLTQHKATPEQMNAGVSDPPAEFKADICSLLNFETLPSNEELEDRANALARMVTRLGYDSAMIGGAPFFMETLSVALRNEGVTPCFAFSLRESTEETQADGSVRKVAVFRHKGFVYRE